MGNAKQPLQYPAMSTVPGFEQSNVKLTLSKLVTPSSQVLCNLLLRHFRLTEYPFFA